MEFEIYCKDGSNFRFDLDHYRWEYDLIQGSIDEEDRTRVKIYKTEDDEDVDEDVDLVVILNDVIALGEVDAMTALAHPRLKLRHQCPRCSYVEPKE